MYAIQAEGQKTFSTKDFKSHYGTAAKQQFWGNILKPVSSTSQGIHSAPMILESHYGTVAKQQL